MAYVQVGLQKPLARTAIISGYMSEGKKEGLTCMGGLQEISQP